MAEHHLQLRPVGDDGLSGRFRLGRRRLLSGAATALVASGAGVSAALAQLRVDITKGVVQPIPIAVSPFAGDGPADRERGLAIAEVIGNDLQSSGLFELIDRRAYIQSPDELRSLPRFADWRQINAQALVSGTVQGAAGGGQLAVEFRLWDVFAGEQMRGLRFDAPEASWRRIGHKIADVIYERLTGEPGYFDTRIAYIAETGPAARRVKRVAVMDWDGANSRYLTDGSFLALTPRFSPDGSKVAYMGFRQGPPRVFVADVASGREGTLGDFQGMTFAPRFSPDGRSLLLTLAQNGNSDIYLWDIATRRATRLTDDAAIDTSPSFSPDGSQIVFNSDRGGRPLLYVMSRNGGGARRISYGEGRYGSPVWSPRGDFIAFMVIKGGYFNIGIMRPDGSDERLLTRSALDESPSWAPNGRTIMFARQDGSGRRRLFTIDVSGYNEREVPTPTDASDPDWSPRLP
ncbi:Tol-Pal system beta propeller repeat protein TolB [Benzoatithermus flavus]|uniref:Tol-Pal system protein TolB n=1 Tax=Benzoatithermus flavus TaxID=3108223 RepID=A0ABU8XTQ6_9PROT